MHVEIRDIKKLDIFWECSGGHDERFVALEDARHMDSANRTGWAVNGRANNGDVVDFFVSDSHPAYGPHLYHEPQYS